ncbi:glycoside hydrolase family 28 protein [Galbibacter sp. PAP.153]|uniref:glycoside hydrolase family 28 protein n=1 Tax=Galbibacter sp. PAP.153 TaxID=3104623 RepID=UPI00300BC138
MSRCLFLGMFFSFFFISCQPKKKEVILQSIPVSAPFGRVAVKTPDFSNLNKYYITNFNAVPGDKKANTQAIKLAIEKARENGGGTIVIPKGEWMTGKIHLKSNINLHLEKGAVLLFSDAPEDYLPPVHTTWEGLECFNYSPLIYAYECKNIAITGQGTLKAEMGTWRKWFDRPPGHMNSLKRLYNMAAKDVPVEQRQMVNDSSNFRPQFIQFNRSENILLDSITITHSPFWVIHPYLSKNVTIKNVKVFAHGHNNDGVDPEMSQHILIENCVFDQGDDAIAVKSGRNQDAWKLNTPSKDIVIKNCKIINGHQLLAIGSELSGGVENIYMSNCEVAENAKLNHLLFIKTNERRGGYVKNIYMDSIQAGKIDAGVLGIETDVLYQWRDLVPTYERRLTLIDGIYMNKIHAKNVEFLSRILGQEEKPVKNVRLTEVASDSIRKEKHIHQNVDNFNQN